MSSIKLWKKQKKALDFALERDEVALFCEQRTGKTYLTLALIEELMREEDRFIGLMVCLLNNKESTWVDKSRELLPGLSVHMDWEEFKKAESPKLLLIHYELLPRIIKKLVRYKKFTFAGVDEAHRIAKRGTKQSRAMGRMSWVKKKLILTGTPIEKQPIDIWAQFRFLAPDVFGTRWEDFFEEYMDYPQLDLDNIKPGTPVWQKKVLQQRILKSKATFKESKYGKFSRLVRPYSYRLTKADVGILEPEVIKVPVALSGSQRRCYDDIERSMLTRTPAGRIVTAPMAITSIMKKRQLASGFIYSDDEEVEHIGGAKLEVLMDYFDRLSKPIVVFTAFKPDTDLIYEELSEAGYQMERVYGKTKKKDRPDIWRAFQRAELDGIVCQIKTGGVGVDLWKSNNAIVHSMGHSYIDFDQAKARMDAKHKTTPNKFFVLCGENTIDEDLFDLVLNKKLTGDKVLKNLKRSSRHGKR